MNATLKQAGKLIELVTQKELTDEQLQKVIGSGLITDIFEAAKKGTLDLSDRDNFRGLLGLSSIETKPVINSYIVDIDFTTLEQGISAGDYKCVDLAIRHSNVSFSGVQGQKEIFTICFDKLFKSFEEVIVDCNRFGFKPAGVVELLALGKKHSEAQEDFPVVAIGPVTNPNGVLILDEYDTPQGLLQGLFLDNSGIIRSSWNYLVLRK